MPGGLMSRPWPEVLTAILRDDSPPAGCLVRLAKNVLAGLLIPAEGEPAAADRVCEAGHELGDSADRVRGLPAGAARPRSVSRRSVRCLPARPVPRFAGRAGLCVRYLPA